MEQETGADSAENAEVRVDAESLRWLWRLGREGDWGFAGEAVCGEKVGMYRSVADRGGGIREIRGDLFNVPPGMSKWESVDGRGFVVASLLTPAGTCPNWVTTNQITELVRASHPKGERASKGVS